MKAVSIVLHSLAVGAALLVSVTAAQADDFMDACVLSSGGGVSERIRPRHPAPPYDGGFQRSRERGVGASLRC